MGSVDVSRRTLEGPDLAGTDPCRLIAQSSKQSVHSGWYGEHTQEKMANTGEGWGEVEPKSRKQQDSSFLDRFNGQRSPPPKPTYGM